MQSYPSIFSFGHPALKSLFSVPVQVEEKVDGSQFGMSKLVHENGEAELRIRSKGAVMVADAPEKMFTKAAETAHELFNAGLLRDNWSYRLEYLRVPSHNTLQYDRVPLKHLIGFDIQNELGEFLSYEAKRNEFMRLGLETVPLLYFGMVESATELRKFLDTTSILGGQLIEGMVIKPIKYDLYGVDKKVLLGKFVSEKFKEIHAKVWGENNPSRKDIVDRLIEGLRTPARWNKSIQHLRDDGKLTDSPRDIGMLIKAIQQDIDGDVKEIVAQQLLKHFWPQIMRATTAGFPEYWKQLLLDKQFKEENAAEEQGTKTSVSEELPEQASSSTEGNENHILDSSKNSSVGSLQ